MFKISIFIPSKDLVSPSLYCCSFNFLLLILLAPSTISLLLIHAPTNLSLHSTSWWSERSHPIPRTILTSCTYPSLQVLDLLLSSLFPLHLDPLPLLCIYVKLLCLKCVTHTQTPFCAKFQHSFNIIILSWKSKSTSYASPCPISYPSI